LQARVGKSKNKKRKARASGRPQRACATTIASWFLLCSRLRSAVPSLEQNRWSRRPNASTWTLGAKGMCISHPAQPHPALPTVDTRTVARRASKALRVGDASGPGRVVMSRRRATPTAVRLELGVCESGEPIAAPALLPPRAARERARLLCVRGRGRTVQGWCARICDQRQVYSVAAARGVLSPSWRLHPSGSSRKLVNARCGTARRQVVARARHCWRCVWGLHMHRPWRVCALAVSVCRERETRFVPKVSARSSSSDHVCARIVPVQPVLSLCARARGKVPQRAAS